MMQTDPDSTLTCMAVLCGAVTSEELVAIRPELSNPASDLGATLQAIRWLFDPARSASDSTSGDPQKSSNATGSITQRVRVELLSSINDVLGYRTAPWVVVLPNDPRPARGAERTKAIRDAGDILDGIRQLTETSAAAGEIMARLGVQVSEALGRVDPGASEAIALCTRYAMIQAASGDTGGALELLAQQERQLRGYVGTVSKAYVPIYTTRAEILSHTGQTGAAIDAMEYALSQQLLSSGRQDPDLHFTAINCGVLCHEGDELEAAMSLGRKQLRWLQDSSEQPAIATWTAAVHARLAAVSHDLGDSVTSKEHEVAASQQCEGANVHDLIKAQCSVISAVRYESERNWRDATQKYGEASEIFAKHQWSGGESYWAAVRMAACMMQVPGEPELFVQVAQLLARLVWRGRHPSGRAARFLVAWTHQKCAMLRLLQGRARSAERWARSALSLISESGVADLRQLGEFKARIADALFEQGRFAEAGTMYRDANRDLGEAGVNERLLLWLELRLARCMNGSGDFAAAQLAQQAVARRVSELGIEEQILVYEATDPWLPTIAPPIRPPDEQGQQLFTGAAGRPRPIVKVMPSEQSSSTGVEARFKWEGRMYLDSPIIIGQLIKIGFRL